MPQPLQNKPAAFIHKLCNILRSKEHAKIIHWDHQEKGIRILNQKRLEEQILPRYYRHNRFSSFVRQLNMYDFHKVHLPDHRYIFRHPEFDPKRKEQIHLIRRKITFDPKSSEQQDSFPNLSMINSRKENNQADIFFKSSKNMIIKQSFYILGSQRHPTLSRQKALEELLLELTCFNQKKEEFINRLKQLKKDRKYRFHLKNRTFIKELHQKFDFQYEQQDDNLSELSIEDQLLFKTKRSLAPRSLKLVQSGQLVFRKDTLRNILNF